MTDMDLHGDTETEAEVDPRAAKMPEVLRLATALAEQMLASQIMGRAISGEQFTALVSAARLLQDNNVPWPPLVQEVVHELAERMNAVGSEPDGAAG
ncbi:hypothetical protein WYO_0317 [Methylobacterium sp. GXF4]|jgi:hypothetical protein|uniref:Uncharacterized protein n=1 Tax=Methylobacterium brachiatum TaxID=269660 RepID=A0ABV1RAH1_9HYPH|nr:hypothetical protein [Methylobacterium sp. GXF4]EIZ86985.1 hypothetical protein WYO_0317 [Methylobacterium sp. GXF4]CAA2160490.1 hypothetical protein MBRA_05645 [Methylobacterium brachiatum]